MQYIDINEQRYRRLKMLLDTAQQVQANQIAREEMAYKNQLLQSTIQENAFNQNYKTQQLIADLNKQRMDEKKTYLSEGYTPLGRGKLLSMSPKERRATLGESAKDSFGGRYSAPEPIEQRLARLATDPNTLPGTMVYDKKTGTRYPVNPKLTDDQAGAAAALEYITPRYERLNQLVDTQFKDTDWSKLVKQVTVGRGGDLIVPDGSPLEEMMGLINDMRLTGFGLGGKNFTENEAKIVFGRLDPTGKSRERYLKDLRSLPDFFKAKIKAGVGGTMEAKKAIQDSNQEDFSNLWS